MLSRLWGRGFASGEELARKTFERFSKKYAEHLAGFKDKTERVKRVEARKPEGRPYSHPFDCPYKPINICASKNIQLESEMMGPEMVSPHYENFLMSRKHAVAFWAGIGLISAVMTMQDLAWMMRSCLIPWLSWGFTMYFFVEGRKSMIKPLLVRFYRQIAFHEVTNLEDHYKENTEAEIREQMARAKSQLEYRMVHDDFGAAKNSILTQFLINEQLALKHHINARARTLLAQAESFEAANERRLLAKVIEDAHLAIEAALRDNAPAIEQGIFESALRGIEKGQMTYQDDPLLPFVVRALEQNVRNFSSLSAEEQRRLISLSTEQLESIRANDQRLKKEFLESEPKIDPALKAHPSAARQLAGWGK
jgi:hypothetical protein